MDNGEGGYSLEVKDLHSGYGDLDILHGVDLAVPGGMSLGIIGPNGAGKTTFLNTIAGLVPVRSGDIRVDGVSFASVPAHKRVSRGVALVPEGRQVIAGLRVQANLDITLFARGRMRPDKAHQERLAFVFDMFPVLQQRRGQMAGSLSGGEQQMLAFARALMTRPQVLLVDEPSQGLAPRIVSQVTELLNSLKDSVTLVVVEQNEALLHQVVAKTVTMRLGRFV